MTEQIPPSHSGSPAPIRDTTAIFESPACGSNGVEDFLPLRLNPGDDLRAALVDRVAVRNAGPAFVVSGIGSLVDARLRFAGESGEAVVNGPLEIISISGSVTSDGAHLHMAVSDGHGRVTGGHVCFGSIVRTTVEAVLLFLPAWHMGREHDSATGYDELVIRPRADPL